ncbi:hypothetical protein CXB51_028536 [Gossypium anomalum]|uniref:Uncharacterized protein n=1 Tax=Gossypium anomalum TaxID=47600 RepID=A0A8J5YH59_9ROSI|nr:hypothetical protein CXB51_028536 [Gossypium anomalum]
MESEFLNKMEDKATAQIWSEKMQIEKGDSLTEGYVSVLCDFTRISVTQNNLQELKEIWLNFGIPPTAALLLENGFGTYCGSIHDLTLLPENLSRQGLFQSYQHPNFPKKANEHHGDEGKMDDDPPESPRRGCRMKSPLDDPR